MDVNESQQRVPDMPILVQRDDKLLARVRAAAASAEHVQHDLEGLRKLKKPYVVLFGDQVVGVGQTPEAAWDEVAAKVPKSDCVLVHVPRKDETYFF